MIMGRFKRADKIYIAICLAENKSNDNEIMIVYHPDDNGNDIKVMNFAEFMKKFKNITKNKQKEAQCRRY